MSNCNPNVPQKSIQINYEDGYKYYPLLTCENGAAVVGLFDWQNGSKTAISAIQCVSTHGLPHPESIDSRETKEGIEIVITLGDASTKPNLELKLKLDLIKDEKCNQDSKND